jgi:predicted protein tyrosine phosphatase
MPIIAPATIAVCPLRKLDATLAETGATRLVSVVNEHLMPPTPAAITASTHLPLPISEARLDHRTAAQHTRPSP